MVLVVEYDYKDKHMDQNAKSKVNPNTNSEHSKGGHLISVGKNIYIQLVM